MAHLPNLILDLALILGAAGFITLLFRKLKQPMVLGYILAGLLVGPNFPLFPTIVDMESIRTWAEIGVIFLLFGLGLEFSFRKLVKTGTASSITAVFEVTVMLILGYVTGKLLGWSKLDSIFLGGILSISSTTIIIRAFEELGVKNRKFAGLVFGILIIEDLVAVLLLVLLSTLALSQKFAGAEMISSLVKLGFFLVLWFLAGIFLIPSFLRRIRGLINEETLLIVSLALCFLMVVLAVKVGFSPALGAFVMGSILAETTYAEKIEHETRALKSLFGAVFFVSVGMLIDPVMLVNFAWPITFITLVTVIGKLLSTTIGALIAGQPLKDAIKAGMSLSQIGEFSFIIATLGLTLQVTSEFLYPVAVAVSAVTTFVTPLMIRAAEPVYRFVEKRLPPGVLQALDQYSSGIASVKGTSEWNKVLRSVTMIIVINTVIITGIILLVTKFLQPVIAAEVKDATPASLITAFLAIIAMTPFLWALTMKRIKIVNARHLWLSRSYNRGPFILLQFLRWLLGVFLLGFLLNNLFSALSAFLAAIAIVGLIGFILSKRLQVFYSLMEQRFISNLNARQAENEEANNSTHILPWDAHIADFLIPQEAEFAGRTLAELQFRERFGVNIARIKRGRITLNIPQRNDVLFPGDLISVIGTDEQLEGFRNELEFITQGQPDSIEIQDIVLQKFTAGPSLHGKSILESKIRELTGALIVGVERNGVRMLNPESTTVFQNGDIVWVAGQKGIAGIVSREYGPG